MGRSRNRKKKQKASGPGGGPDDRGRRQAGDKKGGAPSQTNGSKGQEGGASTYDSIRENIEAIVFAFVLALVIRHFAVEAFVIPTGSMAPTLYGIHAWSQCPNCDTDFNMGLRTDDQDIAVPYERRPVYRGACPECGLRHHRSYPPVGLKPLVPGRSEFVCDASGCGTKWVGAREDYHTESVIQRTRPRSFSGQPSFEGDVELQCPTCQLRFVDVIKESNQTGGHKILVNKFAYRIGKPERWDVIVFHFDEEKNYIKRLLALPGETVWIVDGDLYVRSDEKPLHVARKTDRPDAQDSLWIKIADTEVAERGFNPVPAWKEVFQKGAGMGAGVDSKWWTWNTEPADITETRRTALRPGHWTVNALKPSGRVACLRFARRCENAYSYNSLSPEAAVRRRTPEQVGDKKVAFTIRPSAAHGEDPWVGGEIREGDYTYQFRVPVGKREGARATLRRLPTDHGSDTPDALREAVEDAPSATADVFLPLKKPSEIRFENADDRVSVWVDAEEVLSLDYESRPEIPAILAGGRSPDASLRGFELEENEHYLMLLAQGVSADFPAIRVYRDVYYTSDLGRYPQGATVVRGQEIAASPQDRDYNEYFPCGDNSPSSFDGRYWGTFPQKNLMGKAFVVFWPAIPWKRHWQCKFIH